MRGAKSLYQVSAQRVLQMMHLSPNTSAPGMLYSGSIAVGLKLEVSLCASLRGKSTSYRRPRFKVKSWGQFEIVLRKDRVIPGDPTLAAKHDIGAAVVGLAKQEAGKAKSAALCDGSRGFVATEVDVLVSSVDRRVLLIAHVAANLDVMAPVRPDECVIQAEAVIHVVAVVAKPQSDLGIACADKREILSAGIAETNQLTPVLAESTA